MAIPSLNVERGGKLFISGPSGSGKTTLLNLAAGLIVSKSGRIMIGDRDMAKLSGGARDRLRADAIGLIFQQLNLIPYLSPVQNVCLSTRFSRARHARAGTDPVKKARELLGAMGMHGTVVEGRAAELSIGQQQRVAAARALIGQPTLILADEPTSALDGLSRDQFMTLLFSQAEECGAAVVMVSHDLGLAANFDTMVQLQDIATFGGHHDAD